MKITYRSLRPSQASPQRESVNSSKIYGAGAEFAFAPSVAIFGTKLFGINFMLRWVRAS
jgi:hypothetical protein